MKFLRRQFLKSIGLVAALPFAGKVFAASPLPTTASPVNAADVATKNYVDSLTTGLTFVSDKPVQAVVGDIYYDSSSSRCLVYTGTAWVPIAGPSGVEDLSGYRCSYCGTKHLSTATHCTSCGAST
jgi:hypothetical protein